MNAAGILDPINTRKRIMLTFNECLTMKPGKKLDHNTRLIKRDDDTFAVRLYATDVVLIHRDGTYTLNNGGYQTVTTKDRINKFSPARVHQHRHEWFIGNVEFTDGITVDASGNVIDPKTGA